MVKCNQLTPLPFKGLNVCQSNTNPLKQMDQYRFE